MIYKYFAFIRNRPMLPSGPWETLRPVIRLRKSLGAPRWRLTVAWCGYYMRAGVRDV